MKKYILAVCAFAIIGCAEQNYVSRYEDIKVLSIKKPMYFKIKYLILKTGQIVETSAKHCTGWKRVKVGGIYSADINRSGCGIINSIQ